MYEGSVTTEDLSYALYDVIALEKLFKSCDFINQWKSYVEMFNIPVSMAIYDTANTINKVQFARKYIEKGICYPYINTNKSSEKSIVGAYTFNNYN